MQLNITRGVIQPQSKRSWGPGSQELNETNDVLHNLVAYKRLTVNIDWYGWKRETDVIEGLCGNNLQWLVVWYQKNSDVSATFSRYNRLRNIHPCVLFCVKFLSLWHLDWIICISFLKRMLTNSDHATLQVGSFYKYCVLAQVYISVQVRR